jgi:hypothetical protein
MTIYVVMYVTIVICLECGYSYMLTRGGSSAYETPQNWRKCRYRDYRRMLLVRIVRLFK